MKRVLFIATLVGLVSISEGFIHLHSTTYTCNSRRHESLASLQPCSRKVFRSKETLQTSVLASSNKHEEVWSIKGIEMPKTTAKSLSLLLFSQFVLFIGVGAVIPTIPLYGKEIGLSSAMNGIVISAPALALLFLAKSSGQFADKARKPAMIWGMAIIALSDLGTALAPSLLPLVIARLGLGAGRCISESGERGILADLAATIPELRGRVLASQQAVLALGIALGAPLGGLVVETYGPRASFLCVTFAALVALVLYCFLPETVEGKALNLSDVEEESDTGTVEWSELLQESKWRSLSLFEIGAKFGYAAKLASIPVIASNILPGGAIGAGSLISAAGLSGLVGGPIGGLLVDKYGAKTTMIITGVTSGVGLMSIPFALQIPNVDTVFPTWALFCASVLTWSTSVAAQNPSTTALAQELAPEGSEATAMALPRAAGDGVYLFAPLLLGTIADLDYAPIGSECFFAGLCGLLGTIVLVRQ